VSGRQDTGGVTAAVRIASRPETPLRVDPGSESNLLARGDGISLLRAQHR
jgi:hypothetical protein